MKLDGLDHPKTLDLGARLNVEMPQVIGHLELLWAFVATKTPRGDVGKWPNGAIARGAQWRGDPDLFVNSLIEAGFIEHHPVHKLVVHDWKDHCPSWVRSKLMRPNGEGFAEDDKVRLEVTDKQEKPQLFEDENPDASADGSADTSADGRTGTSADSVRAVPHAMPCHAMPCQEEGPKSSAGLSLDANSKQGPPHKYPSKVGIERFLADCKAVGVKPIPEGDPVFTYADEAGIAREHLELCFREFVERMRERKKRYQCWRSAFGLCVRERWYKLWYIDDSGESALTADGLQAERKHRGRLNGQARQAAHG